MTPGRGLGQNHYKMPFAGRCIVEFEIVYLNTCIVSVPHVARAHDWIVVAPCEVDVGVVNPGAFRHCPVPLLLGGRPGWDGVGIQMRVNLGHVGYNKEREGECTTRLLMNMCAERESTVKCFSINSCSSRQPMYSCNYFAVTVAHVKDGSAQRS